MEERGIEYSCVIGSIPIWLSFMGIFPSNSLFHNCFSHMISSEVATTMTQQITTAMGQIVGSIASLSGAIVLVAGTFIVIGIVTSVLKLRR